MIDCTRYYKWERLLSDFKYILRQPKMVTGNNLEGWNGKDWYEIYRDDNIILLGINLNSMPGESNEYIRILTKKRIQHLPKHLHEMLQLRLDLSRIK